MPKRPKATFAELKAEWQAKRTASFSLRIGILSKLGALKTDEAAAFLFSIALTAAEQVTLRRYALSNCGRSQRPSFLPKLAQVAEGHSNVIVRAGAIEGLGNYGDKAPLDVLMKAAADSNYSIAYAGVNALVAAKPKDLNARLRKLIDDSATKTPNLIANLIYQLARVKHPDLDALVTKYLAEWDAGRDDYSRARLIDALASAGLTVARVQFLLEHAGDPGARTTSSIVRALTNVKSGPAFDWLVLHGLESEAERARLLVANALGRAQRNLAIPPVLVEGLAKEKASLVVVALIDALIAHGAAACDQAFELLLKKLGDKDERVVIAAISALGFCKDRRDDPALARKLLRLAKNRRSVGQAEALAALGRLKHPEALELAKRAFRSKDWRVRAAAIEAIDRLRDPAGIDVLLDQLKKETGRLRGDIVRALQSLTGKDLPDDVVIWRRWWRANKDGFKVPPRAEGAGALAAAAATATGFYGMQVRSTLASFVLDISGSMSGAATFVPSGLKAQGGAAPNKLEVAKFELLKVLDQFATMKKVRFNIIFFDTTFEPWQPALVPATQANLAEARAFVTKQRPRGGTNIYDSLEKAMQDPEVDTIYLLTDGAPGSGKFVNTADIRREIKNLNRTRRIVINTIGIQVAGSSKDFLEKLAQENGGTFVGH